MLAMECGWHLTAGEGEGGRGTQKTHKSGHLWKSRPSLPVPKPPQLVLLREGVEVGSGAWHVNMQGSSLSVRQPWRALGGAASRDARERMGLTCCRRDRSEAMRRGVRVGIARLLLGVL